MKITEEAVIEQAVQFLEKAAKRNAATAEAECTHFMLFRQIGQLQV